MSITAASVIGDAYARLNRLAPGETLGADEAAFGFDRLNVLVDELSAEQQFLYKDNLTSASVSASSFTLGAGSWAAVAQGSAIVSAEVVNATSGNYALLPLTMQKYAEQVALPASAGLPSFYAYDGLATVYLYPVPTAQTIQLQTRTGVATFADQTTGYTVPPGYQAFLGAELAVRLAPAVLGGVPADVRAAAKAARAVVSRPKPPILDVYSFAGRNKRRAAGSILNG